MSIHVAVVVPWEGAGGLYIILRVLVLQYDAIEVLGTTVLALDEHTTVRAHGDLSTVVLVLLLVFYRYL
jgi:hypothetical protein